ncbi:MAG: ABC transporter permease [Chloroflexi bacterium]|nr:MAG: ABC transporter permease [Chloroflexota bacterium]
MIKYTIRRLIQAVPILFGISILSFLLMTASPGGPTAALTLSPNMSARQREAVAQRLGVNDPVPVQYLRWLTGDDWMRRDTDGDGIADTSIILPLDADGDGEAEPPGNRKGVLRGDFGNSFFSNRPVIEQIKDRIPATLELGVSSLIVGLLFGVPIGIISAVGRGGIFDNVSRVGAVIFNAVPVFWLGLILILVFGSMLDLLPMGNRCPNRIGACPPLYDPIRIKHLILPTFTLATGLIAVYSRYMRAAMLDVINEDYMRTAKAKGLSNRAIWFKHGARNAFIPLATFLGPALAGLLSGAVVTERIFAWPGMGRLAVDAVVAQDFPVVMATVIFGAIATILGYLLSDILYAWIDPRIRLH